MLTAPRNRMTTVATVLTLALLSLWVGGSALPAGAQDAPPAENAAFCDAIADLVNSVDPAPADPDAIQAQVETLGAQLLALADTAPASATELMAMWTDAHAASVAILEPVGYDWTLLGGDELNALLGGLFDRQAQTRAWARDNCPAGSGFPAEVHALATRECTIVDGAVADGDVVVSLYNGEPVEVTVQVGDQTVVLPANYGDEGTGDGMHFDSIPTVTVNGQEITVDTYSMEPCTTGSALMATVVRCGSEGIDGGNDTLYLASRLNVDVEVEVSGYGMLVIPTYGSDTAGASIAMPAGEALPTVTALGEELVVQESPCYLDSVGQGDGSEATTTTTTTTPTTSTSTSTSTVVPTTKPATPVAAQPRFTG